MSEDKKIGFDLMLGLIEDELEERKTKTDRRKKECEDTMKRVTEADRRTNDDRRNA